MAAIFSDRARLQGMLDFEAALARAEAKSGVIPAAAAAPIAAQCRADQFDLGALAEEAVQAGNAAIPMVRHLTRLVAGSDPEASRYVHWGATSQDAIDTGLVLQVRLALGIIDADAAHLCEALAAMCAKHRNTIMVGRTWMQQALPVTLGLKAAGWLSAMERHRLRLARLNANLVLQFGGAVGTLASLGAPASEVTDSLAHELGLIVAELPWHTHRDRVAEFATTLGLVSGTLGKIARDWSLLAQTEIAETFEPDAHGRGGSSTMPHKRNPVSCAAVLASALRVPSLVATMLHAMVQENERGLGGWQAEWDTLPEIFLLTAGALSQIVFIMESPEVDAVRMRDNLQLTHGLVMAEAVALALGARMGRLEAHQLVEAACRIASESRRNLRDVLAEVPLVAAQLSRQDLDRLLDPGHYLGRSGEMVDQVLARRGRSKAKEH